MPRGRKPAPPAEAKPLDSPPIEFARRDLAVVGSNLQQIEEQFGLLPYNRHRVIDEARFYMGQSAEAMLELGKRLLQMKEAEPHGEWLDCLRAIDIAPRIAQYVMRSSLKFGRDAKTFSHLGRAKLYELAFLDDQEIKELAEGGTVADLTLDDVDRMSPRELRAKVREARADKDAADQLIDKKNKKIDDLDTKLNRRRHQLGEAGEARAAMCASVAEHATAITTAAARIDELMAEALAADMLTHVPTQDAVFRAVHLALRAVQGVHGRYSVIDVDDPQFKAIFEKAVE